MRLFNKCLRKSSSAAGARQRLGALLIAAMVVASATSAGATETYRGDDPDSYECSSDYQILNRFSAPPGVPANSIKYADIKFTLENNVISVKDASNSRDLAYISVDEHTKYCAVKKVEIIKKRTEPFFKDPRLYPQKCNINYHAFHLRIVIDAELPVRAFLLQGSPPEFDKMDHIVDVDVYRTEDWRKRNSAEGCREISGSSDGAFFAMSSFGFSTADRSALNLLEEAPYKLKNGDTYSVYERQALTKAGPGILQPK